MFNLTDPDRRPTISAFADHRGVISYSDYYPFGWTMPGREGSSGSYRYGFQGQERDDETTVDGGSLDFGARIYDSRVGRWLSTDAHESSYPSFSPYSFAANNPLIYVNPDGKDLFLAGDLNQAKKDIYNLVGGEENFNEYFKIIDNKIVQFNSIQFLLRLMRMEMKFL